MKLPSINATQILGGLEIDEYRLRVAKTMVTKWVNNVQKKSMKGAQPEPSWSSWLTLGFPVFRQSPRREDGGQCLPPIPIWMFPKIGGFPPKSSHFKKVFHNFHHPFWGIYPYFWKHPFGLVSLDFGFLISVRELYRGLGNKIPRVTLQRMSYGK